MNLVHYGKLHDPLRDADLNPSKETYPDRRFELCGEKPRLPYVLWTSPVNSEWGWYDWCTAENWGDLSYRTELELSLQARILTIDDQDDLNRLVEKYACQQVGDYHSYHRRWALQFQSFLRVTIDWIRVAQDYDAVHLTARASIDLHLVPRGYELNTWDCESVAVFRAAQFCRVLSEKAVV